MNKGKLTVVYTDRDLIEPKKENGRIVFEVVNWTNALVLLRR